MKKFFERLLLLLVALRAGDAAAQQLVRCAPASLTCSAVFGAVPSAVASGVRQVVDISASPITNHQVVWTGRLASGVTVAVSASTDRINYAPLNTSTDASGNYTFSGIYAAIGVTVTNAGAQDVVAAYGGSSSVVYHGAGAANEVAYWSGTKTLAGSSNFTYDGARAAITQAGAPIDSEQVTNGGFSGSAMGWTLGADAAYTSNAVQVTCSAPGCTDATIQQVLTGTVAGKTYLLKFDLSGVIGAGPYLCFDNICPGPGFSTGTNQYIIVADSSALTLLFDDTRYITGDQWTLTNVSVREYTPSLEPFNVTTFTSSLFTYESGKFNLGFGLNAVKGNSGNSNIAIGDFVLSNVTTGSQNIGVGESVLVSLTEGNNNSAFGLGALTSLTTGNNNSAFGRSALFNGTSTHESSAFGVSSQSNVTTGIDNSSLGYNSLSNLTTGSDNVAFGYAALASMTTGGNNVGIGSGVTGITTGNYNILIGTGAAAPSATANYQLVIGAGGYEFFKGDDTNLQLVNHNVFIGSSTPSGYTFYNGAGTSGLNGRVYMANLSTSGGFQAGYVCQASTGELIADSGLCLASSARFKHDIEPVAAALDTVLKMRPVSFVYNNEGMPIERADWTRHYGFIAEDVDRIDKVLVSYKDGVPYGVRRDEYTALLTRAIQEQQREIDVLRSALTR